jgi:large subunit ribosomal protein L4
MPSVDILDDQGQKKGSLELRDDIFARGGTSGLVHQAMIQELANKRQGNASTKTRAMVRGGGRKPWRQKGTGRARHGSTRSPIWVHGGVAHGPHPRSYRIEMPKKQKRVAMMRALSSRLADGELTVVESLSVSEPKTKRAVELIQGMGYDEKETKLLLLIGEYDASLLRATKNLQKVRLRVTPNVGILDVLWADRIIGTTDALKTFEETLGK